MLHTVDFVAAADSWLCYLGSHRTDGAEIYQNQKFVDDGGSYLVDIEDNVRCTITIALAFDFKYYLNINGLEMTIQEVFRHTQVNSNLVDQPAAHSLISRDSMSQSTSKSQASVGYDQLTDLDPA